MSHIVLVVICPTGRWKDISFLLSRPTHINVRAVFTLLRHPSPASALPFPHLSVLSAWALTELGSPVLSVKPKLLVLLVQESDNVALYLFCIKHSTNTMCFFLLFNMEILIFFFNLAMSHSILAWRILWTKKPGGLPSIGLQRVGHD